LVGEEEEVRLSLEVLVDAAAVERVVFKNLKV
jgi:hypothetical protein